MKTLGPILVVLAAVGLLACPKAPEGGSAEPTGGVQSSAGEPGDGGAGPSVGDALAPPGGCFSDADCEGAACEGEGCGEDQPGHCTEPGRMCTRDSVPYCGCDGETFRSSGSCPGRRYAHEGEC